MNTNSHDCNTILKELTQIGAALSNEKNHSRLLELILIKSKELCNADGGTLYQLDNKRLIFTIMLNDSLAIHRGGTGKKINMKPLNLFSNEGTPNLQMVATSAAISGKTINIENSYNNQTYDFSGSREFDRVNNYRSQSFLTVPMVNHLQEVIGVLQLINATDVRTQKIIPFSPLAQQIVESLASQAAVAITKERLIEAQKKLFDSLIQLIAGAIDEKSPYTGGHCRRVPALTKMIADAANEAKTGTLKDFHLNSDEQYELEVAAWLHDCGKITTPEYIVDKATKLEAIFDRIQLIDTRFEILKRDAIIKHLRAKLDVHNSSQKDLDDKQLKKQIHQLDEWQSFLHQCNQGGETLSLENTKLIEKIAQLTWQTSDGSDASFLTDDELKNLKITRGTLLPHEREIINNHARVSAKMLLSLPYPKTLKNVALYASSHHEKLDGSGYPQGLKGKELSMQARIITIADIFEALTANDRPYKKAMPLSQALSILEKMKNDGQIDPDLFDLFVKEKLHLKYAKRYLNSQIDKNSKDA